MYNKVDGTSALPRTKSHLEKDVMSWFVVWASRPLTFMFMAIFIMTLNATPATADVEVRHDLTDTDFTTEIKITNVPPKVGPPTGATLRISVRTPTEPLVPRDCALSPPSTSTTCSFTMPPLTIELKITPTGGRATVTRVVTAKQIHIGYIYILLCDIIPCADAQSFSVHNPPTGFSFE